MPVYTIPIHDLPVIKLKIIREGAGRYRENHHRISIDNLELVYGVLRSERQQYQVRLVSTSVDTVEFKSPSQFEATYCLSSAVDKVDSLYGDIQNHLYSPFVPDVLDHQVLELHIGKLNILTERYGDLLSKLDEETEDKFGQLFRQYIDFNPDDDLTRQYQFLGGTRKLVIPKLGNYNRINLPDELSCTTCKCHIGHYGKLVNSMNAIVGQIDWHCLQIAHKMKEHQETTIPGGPFWVVHARND